MLLRSVALLVLLTPLAARAQSADPEARAAELREAARSDVRAGRIEEAFLAMKEASTLTDDPAVLLELAELADRLRLDHVALEAYEAYLERRGDAPDRAEIAGRVRILRLVLAGHSFSTAPSQGQALVDWNGRPVLVRRSADRVVLADWDDAGPVSPELLPFPTEPPGLGRRLSAP